MKPHALRQVAILAMRAFLDDVQVQVVRNEGGLSIRVSSAPDIKKDNSERTNKATSPIQMESDQKLFGTKEEKLVTCAAQAALGREHSFARAHPRRCRCRVRQRGAIAVGMVGSGCASRRRRPTPT